MYSLTKSIPLSSIRQKLYWICYCTDKVISKLDYNANELARLHFILGRLMRGLIRDYDRLLEKIEFF